MLQCALQLQSCLLTHVMLRRRQGQDVVIAAGGPAAAGLGGAAGAAGGVPPRRRLRVAAGRRCRSLIPLRVVVSGHSWTLRCLLNMPPARRHLAHGCTSCMHIQRVLNSGVAVLMTDPDEKPCIPWQARLARW